MPEITIDPDVCTKEGLCAMACARAVFLQEERGSIPEISDQERCFGCGHCVAICPSGAISHSYYAENALKAIRFENVATYDQLLELIRTRRSQRLFREKTVERDVIRKVLEAARFAPSGHNEQSTEFVVIEDPQTIHEITRLASGYLRKLGRQFRNPIGRTVMRFVLGRRGAAYVAGLAPEMEHLASLFNSGTDWILHQPPVLVLFCADSAGGSFAGINANLALQNAALAAETVGLGCFYAGFVVLASDRDDQIRRLLSLPETHKIYGALAMGYPRLKFKKWPDRRPARVTWVGAD